MKKPLTHHILLLVAFYGLLLLSLTNSFGQVLTRGTVNGKVATVAGKSLEFSTLMLLKAKDSTLVKGAISDVDGKYAFDNVGAGQYVVAAQQIGYHKTYSAPFAIDESHPALELPTLAMTDETKNLTEVKVVAQKPFIEQQVDRTVMNVENSIVASGNTALEVLEKAPGVTIDRQNDQIQLKGKAGVIVYIDGKQTYLSQQEVSNLLKNTPSDNIASIEIITNPGSKYDAAGNSGIINIKMKKNKNFGTNGTFIIGTGYGWVNNLAGARDDLPKFNTSLNLNHREGKINFFGNYSYVNRQSSQSNEINRAIPFNGTTTYFDQYSFRPNQFTGHSYKAGLDYFINQKSTIGVLINGFSNDWRSSGVNNTFISDENHKLTSKPATKTDARNYLSNLTGNLNYKYDFDGKGREWTIDGDFVHYGGKNNNDLSTVYYGPEILPVRPNQDVRNNMPSTINILAFKTDYVHPLKNGGKFETGLKSSFVNADNNTLYDTLQQESRQWLFDASRSNQFKYTENINAAYINYAGKFGKLKVQTGLRAEHTHSIGTSVTLNQTVDRNYLNLFPTVFLSRQLDTNNVLNLSFSRRIDRPDYQNLNPFVFYLDPYTYQKGNPFLRPQYTNSVELTHVFKGTLSTTLGYSRTTDFINQETPRQIPAENITYVTAENQGHLDNVSLNVSFPVVVAKWWRMQNNINTYYQNYQTFYSGTPYEVKLVAYNLYTSQNFTLNKTMSAELSGWYNSASQYGFYRAQPMGGFSVGVQKKVMEGKGNVKLNINDPFWLNHFNGRAVVQDINFHVASRWESRRIMLTFTYRFGNQNLKGARDRNSATSAEQNRVKAGN
ncbi:TonB dependent receptor [Spirosoma endophyticum]|uniref:Outer membrane receptor proteins, mostly Fe transport n=1 Tax=Spirosoma endophyticum TaxID=662367 RepID=A0A1I1UBZ7_9BACT|nr:TonB dependent receptor [Spirosoma endophyticum]SFD65470.1 Outer membrane receptor proteins, mostly Fe transport [Spirosoma endophyticum]